MRFLIFLFLAVMLPMSSAFGQDAKLAQQYYQDGEFEKAAVLYEKLYLQQNRNEYYFDRYLECLLSIENYEEVENVLKRELRDNPKNIRLYVNYGNLYERKFKQEEAEEMYQKPIKKLHP
ncbi:MAG: hypothetical protein AAB316_24250, partial [Bacteroidota bacterium]